MSVLITVVFSFLCCEKYANISINDQWICSHYTRSWTSALFMDGEVIWFYQSAILKGLLIRMGGRRQGERGRVSVHFEHMVLIFFWKFIKFTIDWFIILLYLETLIFQYMGSPPKGLFLPPRDYAQLCFDCLPEYF